MAMSRKHYNEAAKIISEERERSTSRASSKQERYGATEALDNVAYRLANMFAQDNGNFDRARFMEACK